MCSARVVERKAKRAFDGRVEPWHSLRSMGMLAYFFASQRPTLTIGEFVDALHAAEMTPRVQKMANGKETAIERDAPFEEASLVFEDTTGTVLFDTDDLSDEDADERAESWADSAGDVEWPETATFAPEAIVFQATIDFSAATSDLAEALLWAIGEQFEDGVVLFGEAALMAAELEEPSHSITAPRRR